MALPVKDQAKYWGLATVTFVLILWFLGDVILPFVLGGAIAYCLDPIADRLERWGLSRVSATVVIMLFGVLIFVITILAVVPTLVSQLGQLINTFPDLFKTLQTELTQRFPQLLDGDSAVRQQIIKIGETLQSKGGELVNGILSSAMTVINAIVLIVVVPVVTFYLLLDWDRMVAEVDKMLPRDHVDTIRQIGRDIDATLAAFIRGQGTVMLIQGGFYAVALTIAGLNFGLVVGAIAGLLSFIPYVGAIVGGGLAIGLALFQFWGNWLMIGVVIGIFAFGQIVEGNVLTPKLVGNSVGLHPVWLIFALSVFGTLFGFVGMLVAVPVSAMIGVVARFGIEQYRSSRLYKGLSDQ
jgi:predicted PurR-regulated permease PerM